MAKKQAVPVQIAPSSLYGSGEFSQTDSKFVGWVNVTLTDNQKAQFTEWQEHEEWWSYANAHERLGITHTIKFSPEEDCFLAKAFMADPKHVSAGYAVTIRAKDAITALARVVYVVETILGTDWKEHAAKPKQYDW